jgi:hypothetical protein
MSLQEIPGAAFSPSIVAASYKNLGSAGNLSALRDIPGSEHDAPDVRLQMTRFLHESQKE